MFKGFAKRNSISEIVTVGNVFKNQKSKLKAVPVIYKFRILNMKKIIALGIILFAPVFAFAQLTVGSQNASGVLKFIQDALQVATYLIVAAAVVWFMWGVFKFIMSAGDEEKRKEGTSMMVAGIIGIAVMVSVWGLVRWVTSTAGTEGAQLLPPPVIPTPL